MPKNRMKLSLSAVACAAVLAAVPHAASAQGAPDETLVSLFVETCTRDGVSAESIIAAIAEQPDWTEVTDITVDVPALRMVPNRSVVAASFRQPESVRQWQRNWNGRMVSTVVATFPQGSAHRTVCALVVPDVRNAGPYIAPMGAGLQALGLTPRHADLPHYQEYAGRLSDMRRARVEIFSRSRAINGGLNTMHIYVGVD